MTPKIVPYSSFERALGAMDLFMNYEDYAPMHANRSAAKRKSAPFLVQQMSSALYDTLAALDQLGHAKEHLSVIVVFDQTSSREMKASYMQAQACVREAMRLCEVLSLRSELVDFVCQPQSFSGLRRQRANAKNFAMHYGTQLLSAEAMLRKVVSAVGRDLSRATQTSREMPMRPTGSVDGVVSDRQSEH